MTVNRNWVLQKLRSATQRVGQIWPPVAGQPVPLDRFMENLGVIHEELPGLTRRVVAQDLLRLGIQPEGLQKSDVPLSGFLFAQPGLAHAFVNKSDLLTRRRFSAAHELGHFVLHFQEQLGAEESFIKADELDQLHEGEPTGYVLDQMEREANQFAAEVLMPEEILRQRVTELGKDFRLNETFLKNQLASELLVSREAMLWRLKNLKLLPATEGEA